VDLDVELWKSVSAPTPRGGRCRMERGTCDSAPCVDVVWGYCDHTLVPDTAWPHATTMHDALECQH